MLFEHSAITVECLTTCLHGFLDGAQQRRPRVLYPLHRRGHGLGHDVEGLKRGNVVGHDDGRLGLVRAFPFHLAPEAKRALRVWSVRRTAKRVVDIAPYPLHAHVPVPLSSCTGDVVTRVDGGLQCVHRVDQC